MPQTHLNTQSLIDAGMPASERHAIALVGRIGVAAASALIERYGNEANAQAQDVSPMLHNQAGVCFMDSKTQRKFHALKIGVSYHARVDPSAIRARIIERRRNQRAQHAIKVVRNRS